MIARAPDPILPLPPDQHVITYAAREMVADAPTIFVGVFLGWLIGNLSDVGLAAVVVAAGRLVSYEEDAEDV